MFGFFLLYRTLYKRGHLCVVVTCFTYLVIVIYIYLYLFIKIIFIMFGYEKIARDIGNARGTREYFSVPLKPIYPRGYLRITEHSNIPFISMTYFRTLPEHYTFTPNITRNTTYWYVLTQATIYAKIHEVYLGIINLVTNLHQNSLLRSAVVNLIKLGARNGRFKQAGRSTRV